MNVFSPANSRKRPAKCIGTVAKSANNRVGGGRKLGGGAFKAHATFVKQRHTIARNKRLGNVMSDNDCCKAKLPLILRNHSEDGISPQRVQTGRRFIEQHQFRAGNNRTRQSQALLHSAGKLTGIAIAMHIEFELPQGFEASLIDFLVGQIGRLLQRECHVFQRSQRIKKSIALKEKTATTSKLESSLRISRTKNTPLKGYLPLIRLHDICKTLEKHGFPGTTPPKHGNHAAA